MKSELRSTENLDFFHFISFKKAWFSRYTTICGCGTHLTTHFHTLYGSNCGPGYSEKPLQYLAHCKDTGMQLPVGLHILQAEALRSFVLGYLSKVVIGEWPMEMSISGAQDKLSYCPVWSVWSKKQAGLRFAMRNHLGSSSGVLSCDLSQLLVHSPFRLLHVAPGTFVGEGSWQECEAQSLWPCYQEWNPFSLTKSLTSSASAHDAVSLEGG